ncbi:MAG: DNA topoisomerase 3 [Bacteroides sp.]|nr:DNA topoisomerase 3 [Bacteroides sp.]MCM1086045.1 DNA topoisomerase 3 [Bacteroides sp.]
MKLCVAEKPSVGREIARVIGATTAKNGYMEGNGYWVSWTFGHLCTLFEPQDYTPDWKRWRMEFLPMIPPSFKLKLIPEKGSMNQFEILSGLMAQCEEVINCGDAGQEGEVIQRWVMQKAGCKVPVKRLWISSLTEQAIKDGFAKLYPASDFDNLYAAGSVRAIGDWLLGMNASRAYTLKFGVPGQVLSIGRVQTPTLALLVERQKAIENFKPEKFWELKTQYRGGVFLSTKGRMATEETAKRLCQSVAGQDLEITKVEKKKAKEHPPKLFDLTLLQVESNKKYGFSADKTLQVIQSLYEKKLTTYPRVDTNFLPNDIYAKSPGILRGLVPYATYTQPLLAGGALRKSVKVFNDKKITDHHAIIPTGEFAAAASLSQEEKQVFDMVIRRFIAVFYPDCEYANTTVSAKVDLSASGQKDVDFKATGKVITDSGWRVVFPSKGKGEDEEKDDREENVLPDYQAGERGPHKPEIVQKQTQPPKYMSEGDLLKAMETAGKLVEDEELRDLMKANGIGRPSTRAAIIETLIKRNYVYKDKKRILPTPMGVKLIETIPNRLLKSAELTGQWEKKLRDISDGKFAPAEFMAQLKGMVAAVVQEVRLAPRTVLDETGFAASPEEKASMAAPKV